MKYKNLSKEDKAKVDFYSKLDYEGGLEGMYRYGGLKATSLPGLPGHHKAIFADVAVAIARADVILAEYAKIADALDDEDNE